MGQEEGEEGKGSPPDPFDKQNGEVGGGDTFLSGCFSGFRAASK